MISEYKPKAFAVFRVPTAQNTAAAYFRVGFPITPHNESRFFKITWENSWKNLPGGEKVAEELNLLR